MSDGLTKAEITELSQLRPGRLAAGLGGWWLLMVGTLQLGISLGIWAWAVCALLIGCLQNGMILWTHEAAHHNLHRDKKRNDLLGNLLICGPVGVYLAAYRWHHGRHHRHLGDPTEEVELSAYYCIRGRELFAHLGRHLFGVVAFGVIFRRQRNAGDSTRFDPPPPRPPAALAGFAIGNGALFALCALQGAWYLYFLLWVFPLFAIATTISNFRTIVEHQPSSDVCDVGMQHPVPPITRIVEAGRLERFLVAPVGFHYHYEHHLYPGLPFYALPRVRALLTERGHYERHPQVRSKGYLRTIWNLAFSPDYGVRVPPDPKGL